MRSSFTAAILGLSILSGVVTLNGAAHAEPPCEQREAHVTVAFVGAYAAEIRESALSDLRAALGPQQMGVCHSLEGPRSEKSVSLVEVELTEENRVRIRVDDSLTNKTVARDIRLEDPTDNASALIVAVAIDELLRATWAELSIPKEPPESAPPDKPSMEKKAASLLPQESEAALLPTHRIALEGALEAFVEGSVFVGANIFYGSSMFRKLEWTVFAGPRGVRATNASDLGQVRALALTFGARLSVPVIATETFYFGPELGVAASHAWFRGQAESTSDTPVLDDEFQGWGLTVRGGLGARLHIGGAFIGAVTRVGYPLVALEVRADSEVVGGMTGLEWSNGLSWGFWWK